MHSTAHADASAFGPQLTTHRRAVGRRAGTPTAATGSACPNTGVALARGTGAPMRRAWRATARWPGPRGGTSDAAAGRTMARASGPPEAPGLGDEPGTCPALSDRQEHGSTNVCSNQDGFPSSTYVCSNNLHVPAKVWPLASIRCYLLVPSERLRRPFGNGRLPGDLPQPSRRRGGVSPPRWRGAAPGCGSGSAPACSTVAASARRPGSPGHQGRRGCRRSSTIKIVTNPAEQAAGTSRR